MSISLGRTCLLAMKGHLRPKYIVPITATKLRYKHELPKTVAEISQEDRPSESMENPFEKERQLCILCKHNITPDYKNVRLLSQFQSSYTGRPYGRHITRLCKHKQHQVEMEIKKAQYAGLMGYMTKERTFLEDPKIFDPERPLRPHKYE